MCLENLRLVEAALCMVIAEHGISIFIDLSTAL